METSLWKFWQLTGLFCNLRINKWTHSHVISYVSNIHPWPPFLSEQPNEAAHLHLVATLWGVTFLQLVGESIYSQLLSPAWQFLLNDRVQEVVVIHLHLTLVWGKVISITKVPSNCIKRHYSAPNFLKVLIYLSRLSGFHHIPRNFMSHQDAAHSNSTECCPSRGMFPDSCLSATFQPELNLLEQVPKFHFATCQTWECTCNAFNVHRQLEGLCSFTQK